MSRMEEEQENWHFASPGHHQDHNSLDSNIAHVKQVCMVCSITGCKVSCLHAHGSCWAQLTLFVLLLLLVPLLRSIALCLCCSWPAGPLSTLPNATSMSLLHSYHLWR